MSGFRFQVSGLRVQGLGFRFKVSGFRVQGSGFRVQGLGCRFHVSDFKVQGSGFGIHGSRFKIHIPCLVVWLWMEAAAFAKCAGAAKYPSLHPVMANALEKPLTTGRKGQSE